MKKHIRSGLLFMTIALNSLAISSCSEQIWMGVAEGLAGMSSYGVSSYASSYTPSYSSYGSASYASYGSYSSSSSSSSSKCPRCQGTGLCKTCGGAGEVYDWGSGSVTTKSKYQHRCGVCKVKGQCNVCGGDGQV